MKDVREGLREPGEEKAEVGEDEEVFVDPFVRPRTAMMWEALAYSYRQLASGQRMILEGHKESGNDVAGAALRQLKTLGIDAIFMQDDVPDEKAVEVERRDLAAMFRSFLMMGAFVERGKKLCLASMKAVSSSKKTKDGHD